MTISKRIAAAAALLAAPALIALGGAAIGHADTTPAEHGPSISHPTQHYPFPLQDHIPDPGSREHHSHQRNHGLK